MSKGEKPECIRCGKPQEYNPYQNFWYCPDPDCPPGSSRFPFNLFEELEKQMEKCKKCIFFNDLMEECESYENDPLNCNNFKDRKTEVSRS